MCHNAPSPGNTTAKRSCVPHLLRVGHDRRALASLAKTLDELGSTVDAEALLTHFLEYVSAEGIELYPAQEEAVMELFVGNNVILNTPTGSGKSLVALAAHFRSVALGERSFYTAPIKALVSEKFFDLCRALGAERVGMMTGDATVNREAPVICCTAEILSNLALREGNRAEVDGVVMDEFHYYSDRDRGVAWQIPLLTLPRARFLLMSATLGDTRLFESTISELTGAPTTLVQSTDRPVPLDFEYAEQTLHNTVAELLESGKAPVYVVHFAQRAATEQAQSFMSIDFLSKDEKRAIKEELSGTRFDTPFGKELRKFLHHGIGVHHAGMLPRYRRLVERLAQQGKLRVICGTDTLGVGVNVPIRTVLFTKLCKYDGEKTKVLTVRDFKQIAGRAGRRGYDTMGSVVAQAPEHVIENIKLRAKAGGDPKKIRKLKMRQPPERGYAHWDEDTFKRLQESAPEPLQPRFHVSNAMILNLFEREDDGCRALRQLIRTSHEGPTAKRRHGRHAISMIRSLRDAGVIELLPEGPRVNEDFQSDFSLNQALSLYVVEAVDVLDADDPAYALDVLTLVEATLEDPMAVLYRQTDALKSRALAEMKAEGMEYDERMEELDKIEYPKPNEEFLYATYEIFATRHPWVGNDILRPKSIARDMYELGMTFVEYVKEYGLQRSEGVLLRYLTDSYKALVQSVPESAKTDALYDLTDWLGLSVRYVDASLLDEWEQLQQPTDPIAEDDARIQPDEPPDVTQDVRGFTTMVRNTLWKIVRALSFRQESRAVDALADAGDESWTAERLQEAMADYWQEYDAIDIGPDARSQAQLFIDRQPDHWRFSQILVDPRGDRGWRLTARVDLGRSRTAGAPQLTLESVGD